MRTTRHKSIQCCYCLKELNASTDPLTDASPQPGDITLCFGCAGVNVYDDQLNLIKPSKEVEDEILSDQRVVAAIEKFKNTLAEVKNMWRA